MANLNISGTYSGSVQLANAASGQIVKEYSLHSSVVRYVLTVKPLIKDNAHEILSFKTVF